MPFNPTGEFWVGPVNVGGVDDRGDNATGGPGAGMPDTNAAVAAAASDGSDPNRRGMPSVGADGSYLDANGQPTGGRPLTVEEKAFQEKYPQGGSFSNPLAAQTQAYNTAVANGGNPTSQPLTVEQQSFQNTYPNGGSFPNVSPIAANAQPVGGGGGPGANAGPGVTAATGPQAMAAGQGWYVDSHGRFVSDNMGANARANTTYDANPSFGPGTIIDTGTTGRGRGSSPFDAPMTGQDYTNAGRPLPGNLGLTQPFARDASTGTGFGPGTGGGAAASGPAYNPRLGDTVPQTYGAQGGASPFQGTPRPGTVGAAEGATLDPAHRIVRDEQGHVVAVRDADGYIPGDLKYHTVDEIILNAQELHPEAIELLRALSEANAGEASRRATTVLGGIPNNYMDSQNYQNAATAHNPIARANGETGLNIWPTSPGTAQPNSDVFTGNAELADLLKQTGRTVVNPVDIAGNTQFNAKPGDTLFVGTDGQVRHLAAWEVPGAIAQLKAELATQQPAAGGGGGGGYGGYRPPGGNQPPPPAGNPATTSVTTPSGIPGAEFGTNRAGQTLGGPNPGFMAPMYDEFGRPFGTGYTPPR